MSINDKRRFAVHKEGHPGALVMLPQGNGDTAMIDKQATDGNIPEWAEQERLVSCNLKEHKDWYIARCGEEMYTTGDPQNGIQAIGGKDVYEVSDLAWDAVDEEGDIVVALNTQTGERLPYSIAPNFEERSIKLASLMGLKLTEDGQDFEVVSKDGTVIPKTVEVEVAETYHAVAGVDEETLKEIEKQTFGSQEADKTAAAG